MHNVVPRVTKRLHCVGHDISNAICPIKTYLVLCRPAEVRDEELDGPLGMLYAFLKYINNMAELYNKFPQDLRYLLAENQSMFL